MYYFIFKRKIAERKYKLSFFFWNGELIFGTQNPLELGEENNTYLRAYNFENKTFTCIGELNDFIIENFDEVFDSHDNEYKFIEYKDVVYVVVVDNKPADVKKMDVGKLYRTDHEINFKKIVTNRKIPELSQNRPELSQNRPEYILFIKDDILNIYFLNCELFSLNLQDTNPELQQQPQRHGILCDGEYKREWHDSKYRYYFDNPYIYFICDGFLQKIDCTDNNLEIKTKEPFEVHDDMDSDSLVQNQSVFHNGKIYFFGSMYLYQVDIETKVKTQLLLADLIPYDKFKINAFNITSNNEIRAFGYIDKFSNGSQKLFFMKITLDDEVTQFANFF